MKRGVVWLALAWWACGHVDEEAPSCLDGDGDGFGAACAAGPDCDDAASSCTTKCGDEDADGVPDCRDRCLDRDQDDHGATRPSSEIVGDGSTAVLDCTTDGSTPCRLDGPCLAADVDDADARCTDGAPPAVVTCLEASPCDGDSDGSPDGTPVRCRAGIDSDYPGGGIIVCKPESPCVFGPWSNTQCGTGGTGWHVNAVGTCGTGQGGGVKRCVSVEVQPPDPCR